MTSDRGLQLSTGKDRKLELYADQEKLKTSASIDAILKSMAAHTGESLIDLIMEYEGYTAEKIAGLPQAAQKAGFKPGRGKESAVNKKPNKVIYLDEYLAKRADKILNAKPITITTAIAKDKGSKQVKPTLDIRHCPACNSLSYTKNGTYKIKDSADASGQRTIQRYRCKVCRKSFK